LIDPILEPVGFGFAASLGRYAEVRRRYPEAEMLMGIGNLTELTAADSTGVNALLIAVCQEHGVRAVLTTEVIPWARGAVREVDVARRLMHYAITERTIPKGVDDRLVTIKDPTVLTFTVDELRELQAGITDPHFRIFADREAITVLNNDRFVRGSDIQEIFAQLEVAEATHAFYLGKELAQASLAVTLGKTYRQDQTLSWGYLTPHEDVKADPTSRRVRLTQPSTRVTGTDSKPLED
jgi:dihydropteroate synthase-like protein